MGAKKTNTKRKGAKRIAEIPADIMKKLNRGEIETVNLVECLAIDFAELLKNVVPDISAASIKKMKNAAKEGWLTRCRIAGKLVYDEFGIEKLEQLAKHKSDMARTFAASLIGQLPELKLEQRLKLIKPLADDSHMGVREAAWLFVRDHIAVDINKSIKLLSEWSSHKSEYVRRFASEATRPRGVWCAHINALKLKPELGLKILEKLRNDPSRYVQNSVGNWLNDAAKSKPDFVKKLCKKWKKQSKSKETAYIIKRSLRSLNISG
jgi:3-methyladenine DNA glycosylase AlkC